MQKILKKIDRVTTLEEALFLEELGVDIISVPLAEDIRFSDNRIASLDILFSIKNNLKRTICVAEVSYKNNNFWNIIEELKRSKIDTIQFTDHTIPPIEGRKKLNSLGIKIIYSNIEASYEDDPSWILSRFTNEKEIDAQFFQIDLLGDMENSWAFLNNEANKHLELLQIDDISQLASKFPLMVILDFTPNNILEIYSQISHVKGLCMPIGESSERNDIHYFEFSNIVDILKMLK